MLNNLHIIFKLFIGSLIYIQKSRFSGIKKQILWHLKLQWCMRRLPSVEIVTQNSQHWLFSDVIVYGIQHMSIFIDKHLIDYSKHQRSVVYVFVMAPNGLYHAQPSFIIEQAIFWQKENEMKRNHNIQTQILFKSQAIECRTFNFRFRKKLMLFSLFYFLFSGKFQASIIFYPKSWFRITFLYLTRISCCKPREQSKY